MDVVASTAKPRELQEAVARSTGSRLSPRPTAGSTSTSATNLDHNGDNVPQNGVLGTTAPGTSSSDAETGTKSGSTRSVVDPRHIGTVSRSRSKEEGAGMGSSDGMCSDEVAKLQATPTGVAVLEQSGDRFQSDGVSAVAGAILELPPGGASAGENALQDQGKGHGQD